MKNKKNKIVYYAAGGGIFKIGPFKNEIDAWSALVLSKDQQDKQRSIHPKDSRVWPERLV